MAAKHVMMSGGRISRGTADNATGRVVEPDGFIDRSQRFSYLLACENARRIVSDPGLLKAASDHLERFSSSDPRQRHGYGLWRALLDGPADAIASLLRERSPAGDYARETAPAFPGMPVKTRTRLLQLSRRPLAGAISASLVP